MKNSFHFELFIAWRYLKSKRRTSFISIITYLSIIGVTIGSAALVIVLSVMNGFENEVRSRILGFDAHIRLVQFHSDPISDYMLLADSLRKIPEIAGVSPYIMEKGLLVAGAESDGVVVLGIDPSMHQSATDLQEIIVQGNIFENNPDGIPGMALGLNLADGLRINVGDTISVLSPSGLLTGMVIPRIKKFRVEGIFQTGLIDYDNLFCYIPLKSAQSLYDYGDKVSGIDIKLHDLFKAEEVKTLLDRMLGYPYYPRTWYEMHRNLFSWMQIEKWMMFIVLSLIILVAVFNITASLIMMILEKKRDIGILKSMGASSSNIKRIFALEGLVVGFLGGGSGLLLGFLICWLQYHYQFIKLPGDVYIIDVFPILMNPFDFIFVGTAAVILSFLAAYYPALKAAQIPAAEAIRYE
ncbi:ABC transporter permease [bacterium]|nr:ABC transporter permease [bacterium]